MPEQPLHIEYCQLAGLMDLRTLKTVNDMIDTPNFRYGYRTFRAKIGSPLPRTAFDHNLARKFTQDAELDIRFLKKQTAEFRVAYFLHHFLDLYSERKSTEERSVSECRSWARKEMSRIFGCQRSQGDLLTRYCLRSEFLIAEKFFISPKSQFWLQKLPAKRKELQKRRLQKAK